MSKSVLVNEYNKANFAPFEIKEINETVNVSYLDVLNKSEVEVIVNDYGNCLCKDKNNINDYFKECSKCKGKGKLELNGHEVTCNECKGEKVIRVHDCYLCSNESKILKKTKLKIKLGNVENKIILTNDYRKLIITINVEDKADYLIKGKDIYYLKSVKYTKEDYKNKVSKEIKTLKGVKCIKSEFKINKEIVRLKGEGIDNGDFYFIFENEVKNEKREIYSNVLINKNGYVDLNLLVNSKVVIAKEAIALNENNYVYIKENDNNVETNQYLIRLNKLDKNFIIEDDKLVYVVDLEESDLESDKKSIIVNNEKININYKKNISEVSYITIKEKGLYTKEGRREDLVIKINPYYYHVYKIKIKKNKDVVYVEDYKREDNRLVRSFRSSKYLENYIAIDKENKIVVNNDLILIERV